MSTEAYTTAELQLTLAEKLIETGELNGVEQLLLTAKKIFNGREILLTSRCLLGLANLFELKFDSDRALIFASANYQLLKKHFVLAEDVDLQCKLLMSKIALAFRLNSIRNYEQSLIFLKKAEVHLQYLNGQQVEDGVLDFYLGLLWVGFSDYYHYIGDKEYAEAYLRDADVVGTKLKQDYPENRNYLEILAIANLRLGEILFFKDRYQAGLANSTAGITLDELSKAYPENIYYKKLKAENIFFTSKHRFENAMNYKENFDHYAERARQGFNDTINLYDDLIDRLPNDPDLVLAKAICYEELGRIYQTAKAGELAFRAYLDFNDLMIDLSKTFDAKITTKGITALMRSHKLVGDLVKQKGNSNKAYYHYKEAWACCGLLLDYNETSLELLRTFAGLCQKLGLIDFRKKNWKDTLLFLSNATELYKKVLDDNPQDQADVLAWKECAVQFTFVFVYLQEETMPFYKRWWNHFTRWLDISKRVLFRMPARANPILDFWERDI